MVAPADSGDAVLVEQRQGALWLCLNRPAALNGISPEVLGGLHAGLDHADRDDTVRAVVLAAQGDVFCAGADLKHVIEITTTADGESSGHQSFLRDAGELFNRLEAFPKPTIAAVRGLVLAGGLELILCTDLVVAGQSARIGDAHANFGLLPGGGGSIRLPRRLGPARAKYLLFSGQTLPAADFLGTDLVNSVVPDHELADEVAKLVASIARKSPSGLRRMKQLVNDGLQVPLPIGLRMELQHSAAHEASPDFAEGLSSFLNKRTPKFSPR